MSTSLLKRCHKARAGGVSRARRFVWPFGLTIALLVSAVLIAAAGNSVSHAVQSGTPGASPAASQVASPVASPTFDLGPSTQIIVGEITIEIIDEAIIPVHFESAVGRDVTINVVNEGTRTHNFTIDEFDIDIDLDPGETATVEIEDPELGTYRYYSDLPEDEGLEGTMSVFI